MNDRHKRALAKLPKRDKDYPPNLVTFSLLCRPTTEDVMLPSAVFAHKTLIQYMARDKRDRDWSDMPIELYWAYQQLDWWNFRDKSEEAQRKIFDPVWQQAVEHADAGFKFPPVPKLLEENPTGVVHDAKKNQAIGKSTMGELRGMFE